MGADEARSAGLAPTVAGSTPDRATDARDTADAAHRMADLGVDLLLFAGGDGTARDIYNAIADRVPVVGLPAGVKMHSGVYAISPRAAGDLAVAFLSEELTVIREMEVMDIDEEAFRANALKARLYGYLRVPYDGGLVQGAKGGMGVEDEVALEGIAAEVVGRMEDDCLYVVGPGTTTRAIASNLGVEKTLLGVDLVRGGELMAADVTEKQVLQAMEGRRAVIVVTPIGGQGHIFGRGNQQISPEVIRRTGRDGITVVATPDKLASFRGTPLRVDTGDAEVDTMLSGYYRVITGYRTEFAYRVSA
jgi:predicted polyphosphate/ATP-dependent NAD kinase